MGEFISQNANVEHAANAGEQEALVGCEGLDITDPLAIAVDLTNRHHIPGTPEITVDDLTPHQE